MRSDLLPILERSPVIAAVFDTEDLEVAISSPCEIIFLLCGDICTLESLLDRTKQSKKIMYIHLDLLGGLGKDIYTVRYLKETFAPDGVITTKGNIAKFAHEVGLPVVQRVFMLDSKAYDSAVKTLAANEISAVEILPGIIPSVIRRISKTTEVPIIAGGLIIEKREVIECLNAGATGVSTSCKELWYL